MSVSNYRPSQIIVHRKAIEKNVATECAQLAPEQELFAVVKANGYGHGAVETAKAAKQGGATGFCVATIDEGLELRAAGLTEPILVLGIVDVAYLEVLSQADLAFPIASLEWLQQAQQKLAQLNLVNPLKVHLKIDTGMGRIGFLEASEVLQAIEILDGSKTFRWEGIFTHFATADQGQTDYFEQQVARFKKVLAVLPYHPRYVHVSNSATALWHPLTFGNMIRYGVAMYGLNPSGRELVATSLEPALELQSELVFVKKLTSGEGVGYGKTYTTANEEWIGTVPLGYADGWLRKMQGFQVLVAGKRCEIVGRVCMDQFMIRLPEKVAVGTKVTLIGENAGAKITMQEVAEYLGTINYEVACTFSERLPRKYRD
ncbi:MAG: alanine racemase [Enterococcus sp.]